MRCLTDISCNIDRCNMQILIVCCCYHIYMRILYIICIAGNNRIPILVYEIVISHHATNQRVFRNIRSA